MSLDWTEYEHGWRAGPYRIELAGPRRWIVHGEGSRPIGTTPSLRMAKQAAERADTHRDRMRRVRNGVIGLLVAVAVALSASAWLPNTIGFPIMLVALFFGVRSLMAVEGALTSRAWLHRSDVYQ